MSSHPNNLSLGARPKTDMRDGNRSRERSRQGQAFVQGPATQQWASYQCFPTSGSSGNNAFFPAGYHQARDNWHRGGHNSSGYRQEGGSNRGRGRGGPPNRSSEPGRRGGPTNRSSERGRGRGGPHNRSLERDRGSGGPPNRFSERGRGRGCPMNISSQRGRSRGRGRPLDAKCLRDILDNGIDPTEIVMELATEKSGLKEFLERKEIIRETMVQLLGVMATACLCNESPRNLNSFLAVICQSGFLSQHLTSFISKLSSVGCNSTEASADEFKSCRNIITLLKTLIRCVPTFAMDEVVVNVAVLEIVCNKNDKIPDKIKEYIEELKGICDDLQRNREDIRDREMARSQYKPPPNDFRGIDIIPQTEEVRNTKRPFLRQNLIKGKYQDTEHYLDVQFRLLREDFVAPLREGVGEYLENMEDFQKNPRKRLQDVRLYRGVRITRPIMTRDGTGHLIQFDTSPFQKIRWESSKRLINGSLLCLTEDDFQTVIFATVEGRDVWQLQRGELQVRFIRLQDVIHKSSDATFMMAETSAYFESYRHVLEGLKVYNDHNLPMKSYIVEASNQTKPPGYLDLFSDFEPLYDLRITSQRMVKEEEGQLNCGQNADKNSDTDAHDDVSLEAFPVLKEGDIELDSNTRDMRVRNYVQRRLRAVNILEPGSWPEANTLHFDESQLEAFRAALSSEFVLIQGPPGTGKTYVGLEIVKSLLFNCHAWCHGASEAWDFRPILVVCYTNHALDQFLEGIYHYEKGIVRVGGRCTSESLQDSCISNIRATKRKRRQVPDHIHRRRADMTRFYEIKDILEAAHERIALACSGFVHPSTLHDKQIMSMKHCRNLLFSNHVNPIFLWLVGQNGEGLPKKKSPKTGPAADGQGGGGDEDEDEEDKLLDIAEEAAILAEQRELGNDPTFLMIREESRVNVLTEFAYVPKKRANGESSKETIDRQRMEREIEYCINSTTPMTEEEVSTIRNLWELNHSDRWRLYCYWVRRYIKIQQDTMIQYQLAYEQLSEERKEIDREEDYLILREAKVIGFTTTGAAKHRALLQRVRPRIIIVEEAAEVLEAHIITTLSQDCQHLILIGDHQQLRPKPTVYRLEKQFHLGVSLFERMVRNGLPCHRLGQQHQMRPEISILMKEHFYDGLEDHSSVNNYPSVKGVKKNLFFVEHNHNELKIEDNKSKSNLHEAKFLVEFCYYLLQQGYSPSQITILTTYTGQLFNFKRLMSKEKFEDESGNRVRVSVVDNFQGEENDIILLSLVRSNDEGSIGFLKVRNRVCVALSRAKVGLFCIGNIRLLAEESDLWQKILKTATEANQIGPKIPLVCQNHLDTVTEISCPEDFLKSAPDGGCSLRCEARLDCGHACRLHCHPKDPNHEEYKCMKDCNKECDRGHKCTLRCYEKCQCQVLIRKLFAKCQHSEMVKCHEDKTALCQKPCTKKMPCNRHDCPAKCGEECPRMCLEPCPKKIDKCGHQCKRKCGMSCMTCTMCQVHVEVKQPKCVHSYWVKCKDDPKWTHLGSPRPCHVACERTLKCGHQCDKLCHEPCQTECEQIRVKTWATCDHWIEIPCKDSEDAVCEAKCTRLLPCAHRCTKKCEEPCLKQCKKMVRKTFFCEHEVNLTCHDAVSAVCPRPCGRLMKCGHRCRNTCGQVCDPSQCTLPCARLLPCGHPCKKRCNELCDPSTCVELCSKFLACEHQCQNRCNEPCETLCNRKMLKAMPCGHNTELPCNADVKSTTCLKPCLKSLKCGHRCQRVCCYPCTSTCKELTEKVIPECGHTMLVRCNKEPEHKMCTNKCKKKLQCGHNCPRMCNERCKEECKVGVVRELPGCTHKTELPCAVDPSTVICRKPCEKFLQCKHMCVETCSNSCTVQCRMKVTRQHPKCGHYMNLMYYEDVATKWCREPCRIKMPCNHNCPKMCFEPCKTVAESSEKNLHEQVGTEENKAFFSGPYKCVVHTFQTPTKWQICKVKMQKEAKCGHKIECLCCDDPESIPCQSVCSKMLSCGHPCPGTCSTRCATLKCRVTVSKRIPGCDHMVKIECHMDTASTICQERCARKLACGHPCSKLCSEPCSTAEDLCRKIVVRSIPECGHQKRLQCHEDPGKAQCDKVCKKKLPCGHECRKTCHLSWEACETKCKVRLLKKITQCGHPVKLQCHLDPDSGSFCEKRCQQKLECGHECKEKCGRPCTTMCKETKGVQKMLPCDHVATEVECYKDPQDLPLCREQCTHRLPCGHDCKNACGLCTHRDGRTESAPSSCNEMCRKRLLCGHQCRSKCSDCRGGRLHQPCRTLVDNITLLCGCKVRREQCSKLLYLRHGGHVEYCLLQYHGLRLFEQTDVNTNKCKHKPLGGYCDEPCTKLLKCKHNCIGLCGEPCIDLCRFCNRRKVLKIFPEFQAETDPCYIELQECGDIFEVNDLKQKLGNVSQYECSIPIHPITCPKCGRGISEGRFNEHSGTIAESVQEVVRKLYQQESSGEREAERLLYGSKYVHTIRTVQKTVYGGGRRGRGRGQRGQPRTVNVRQEVRRPGEAHMAWKLKLLSIVNNIRPTGIRSFRPSDQEQLSYRLKAMTRECVNGLKSLLESLLDEKIFLTVQLANDIGCELERLQWSAALERLSCNSRDAGFGYYGNDWSKIPKAVDIVMSPRPFTAQRRKEVTAVLGANLHAVLVEIIQQDQTKLYIHDMQREELGFLAGDWFKCSRDPNHLFQSRDRTSSQISTTADSPPSCPTCQKTAWCDRAQDLKSKGDSEPAAAASSNPSATAYRRSGKEKAVAPLFNKLHHNKLVEVTHTAPDVLQKDLKSANPVKSFEELGLKEELLKGVYLMGFNAPSKILETFLPLLLADPPKNMIAQSQSGTDKTAAFVLNILNRVDGAKEWPQALCLAPTFELALQIGAVVEEMGKCMTDIKVRYSLRGQRVARGDKIKEQIVIGTPGTTLDWGLKWRAIDLSKIEVFVLDEADVMVATRGHQDQSIRIQKKLPKSCQMMLFSATNEESVMKFAEAIIPDPIVIRLSSDEDSLENIKQYYVMCNNEEEKYESLANIYGAISIGKAIIFCRTKRTANWLTEKMTRDGHAVGLLSGELQVEQRVAVLKRYREGKEKVLITTGVMPRGIEIEQVTVVVNFDLPTDQYGHPDYVTYLHRIGRTGHFGKQGLAFNFIDGPKSMANMQKIEQHFGHTIHRLAADDAEELRSLSR